MSGERIRSITTATEALVDPPRPSMRDIRMPPGPSGLPLVGQTFRLRFGLIKLMQEAATYGDISTVAVRPDLIYLVNHPTLNRQILATSHQQTGRGATTFETMRWMIGNGLAGSTGAFHLKQRRLMQPRFHHKYIEHYASTMTEMSSRKSRQWQDGGKVNMEQEMRELTLQIVAKALFDLETHDVVQRVGKAFAETDKYMYLRLTQPLLLRRFFHRLPLPTTRRSMAARAYLDEFIYGLIRERRQSGAEGNDLLCLLLQARYEGTERGMSDELVRDEAVSLYLAGHDPTATTLAYAFFLLSQNPQVEKRFHTELYDVLGDRDATVEDLPNLPITNQIVMETLRLYPSLWALGRMVYESIEVGDYDIPPGVAVMVSPLIAHRDPRWFDDPLKFRPERWTKEFRKELPHFAYFPFGGGPHKCIGESFALMEAKIALATLCRRWRATARGKSEIVPRITIKIKGGMPMTLERRR